MGLHPELGILLILGIGVFGGVMGAWLFQRLRIPQVIGYLVIGLLLGESGFGVIQQTALPGLRPFSFLALSLIGFLVGGELELRLFKQYGRQFIGITLGEGISAFLWVGALVGVILWLLSGDLRVALAGGCVFGAISAATDPASTFDVLQEYRSKGVVTTSLVSVIALDDALALLLYTLGTAAAALLIGTGNSLGSLFLHVGLELFGSMALGAFMGGALDRILRASNTLERSLTVVIGSLLLLAGLCLSLGLDVILSSMTAGLVLVNLSPARAHSLLKTLREFATPVQVMFFVLVGARLQLGATPLWVWGLVAAYVTGSLLGKYTGTWTGAWLTRAEPNVRNYLGLGLFAQGGVAVGLSMMASQHLTEIPLHNGFDLGSTVVTTIAATTLVMQVIGPPCTRHAITRAEERGRNVTEEDILQTLSVQDVMRKSFVTVPQFQLLEKVFEIVTESRQLTFPVVDEKQNCIGLISLDSLKGLFFERDIWNWMIAEDVMVPVKDLVRPGTPLPEALRRLRQVAEDQTIVRSSEGEPVGILDIRETHRELTRRLMLRQGVQEIS